MPKSFNESLLLLKDIAPQAAKLLNHSIFDSQKPISLASSPGRISFSKHCDYVNNDLLYIADDRKTTVICQRSPADSFSLELVNSEPEFAAGFFTELKINKDSWHYYPQAVLSFLQENYALDLSSEKISIAVSSNLPSAGGLSSSHALILSLFAAVADTFQIESITRLYSAAPEKNALKELLLASQKIENARGFNSGLGDPAAEMLCRKSKILCLRLEPELEYSYIDLPKNAGIITAPSFIKADKNLPEFKAANQNIKLYKTLNQKTKEIFGLEADYLGDILYLLDEKSILKKLSNLADQKLANLALYALAEGARIKEIKKKHKELNEEELLKMIGRHLNLSHQAELFDSQARKIDINTSLKEQSGYYGASTKINDEIQQLASSHPAVYGSSISGAGLGGNNSILCNANKSKEIRDFLIEKHYQRRNLSQEHLEQIHISSSEAPARIL